MHHKTFFVSRFEAENLLTCERFKRHISSKGIAQFILFYGMTTNPGVDPFVYFRP